ncbi:MAG: alpha-galactosidase, partial [Clostridia bacterium]|nr:alpha-galactosidase [Clostridia bacterium]
MIHYNAKLRTFQLDGKNSSYVIGVFHDTANYLVHLYYGAKIPQDENLYDMLFRGHHASFVPENKGLYDAGCRYFYPANAPMEYPTEGAGDFRTAALAIKNSDGNMVTDIRYTGHKIYAGKPRLSGLPSLYAKEEEAETLEIYAKDFYTGAAVTLYYTVFSGLDAIVRSVSV